MSIEQTAVIDFISQSHKGELRLTISDHLAWDEGGQHLLLLQEKLNAYLRFIESGELKEKYPRSVGQPIIINLVTKFFPSKQGLTFLEKAKAAISAAGFELQVEVQQLN
ncbi:MAG: hypothetical protein KGH75_09520 [Rhodospirillales bacterium]|nr:hypothetical protein [Rhodospirillales bacterium]